MHGVSSPSARHPKRKGTKGTSSDIGACRDLAACAHACTMMTGDQRPVWELAEARSGAALGRAWGEHHACVALGVRRPALGAQPGARAQLLRAQGTLVRCGPGTYFSLPGERQQLAAGCRPRTGRTTPKLIRSWMQRGSKAARCSAACMGCKCPRLGAGGAGAPRPQCAPCAC